MADFNISQFARMSVTQTDEENFFSHLVTYMMKHELICTFLRCYGINRFFAQLLVLSNTLFIGNHNAATMFVFPGCFEYLWDQLGVPPKISQGQDLQVAIGSQVYEPP